MRLPGERKINVEIFYKMREATGQLLEYVDGIDVFTIWMRR